MLNNNLVSILDLSKNQQSELFKLADKGNLLFSEYRHVLDGKVLGTFFFQPSTRTQFSFQSAFVRLGGHYIGCSDINNTRSGPPYFESICDMGSIISNYCDIIVMRTIDDLQTVQMVQGAHVPVISAGSGNIEHPTQALTDLYTIHKVFGVLTGHEILIVGTPRQRTINSFIKGMSIWGKNNFHILCQSGIEVPDEVKDNLGESIIRYYHTWDSIWEHDIANKISIIYIDKIFNETHRRTDFIPLKEDFVSNINPSTLILHPLPRTAELPPFIDNLNGAYYFMQAKNGLYIRTALFLQYFAL
ncbi:MAG: hypothetical protein HFH72_16930 [Lachnospiraceae bacterium]|nr:hypothetical protein [Lachnospiraceae bacterium]